VRRNPALSAEGGHLLPPQQQEFAFDAAVTGVAFLADGTLAAGLGDGTVRLVDGGGAPRTARPHGDGAAILALAVDLDGAAVLTGGDDGRLARTAGDGAVTPLADFPGRQVDVLAVSAAGALRAAAAGRELRLLDGGGHVVAASADHPSTVTGLAFNPKGKRLAVSHYGGVTLWWTGTLGQAPKRLGWRGSHIGVTWSPEGSTVIAAMQEGELHGWRLADDQAMRMAGYAAKVRSMAWHARPMMLATSGGDGVVVWKFSGGGPMGAAPLELGRGIGRLVACVAVHPQRPLVAAGFDDGQVILCALDARAHIVRLRGIDGTRVTALAWSRDGTRLAAGNDAGAVLISDLAKPAAV
jgi:WD40 repeat protein